MIVKWFKKSVFKIVNPKKFLNNISVFNFYSVDKIKNLDINKAYEKNFLLIQTHNNKNKNFMLA